MTGSVITCEIGLGLNRSFREYLEMLRFHGHNISWLEGRGIFSRTWHVRGDHESIRKITNDLMRWGAKN